MPTKEEATETKPVARWVVVKDGEVCGYEWSEDAIDYVSCEFGPGLFFKKKKHATCASKQLAGSSVVKILVSGLEIK